MRTKASLLIISLFALGACITNSEVGVYPRDDIKEAPPPLPPAPTSSDAGTDAAETGQPDVHPITRATNRLAAGERSTCATTSSDGVVCWGDNSSGQLGNGTTMQACPENSVCRVQGLGDGVHAVFGGGFAHCALRKDNTVLCWGDTVFQQSEDGVYAHHVTFSPRKMPELTNASTVGVGKYFQCALTDGQSTKCYGLNRGGTVGTKSVEEGGEHGEVSGMGKQGRKLAAAQSGLFACAVTGSGALKCWGYNDHGQLGNGTYNEAREATPVEGLGANVTAVAAGTDHACAVVSSRVKCWGRNNKWQLGSGEIADRLTPDTVPDLSGVVALTAGRAHTCALTRAGAVYCWGDYGGPSISADPVKVISANVVEIAAGTSHTCALYVDDSLLCWGSNEYGQLGPFGGRALSLP